MTTNRTISIRINKPLEIIDGSEGASIMYHGEINHRHGAVSVGKAAMMDYECTGTMHWLRFLLESGVAVEFGTLDPEHFRAVADVSHGRLVLSS